MLKQLTFIVALLFALWGQAQTETTLRHIDMLAYDAEGELYFYWQKGKDKFLELELDYKEDEKADYRQDLYDFKIVHYNDENWETLKEIKEEDRKIVSLKDIQRTTLKDFVGKTFKTLPPIYDKNTQTILKILSPQLALLCDIDIEEKDPYQERDYYSLRAINLGKGRNIYLLSDNSYIEGFIVPLKDKTLFLNDRETTKLMVTQYPSSYKDDFIDYKPEEYMLLRPKGKRYELIDIYKQKVLPGRYDTIYYNKFGVIGRRGRKFVLYDSYLQKKDFKGMRSVYFYRDGIEMLNREGAGYYQINGERIEAFPKIVYSLCGTVYERRYTLKKDEHKKEYPYYMLYGYGGFASEYESEKEHYLSDRSAEETLSFVNGRRRIVWDENDSFTGRIYPHPELIRVQQGNKYGLFGYTYQEKLDNVKDYTEIELEGSPFYKRMLRIYPKAYLIGEELLPIVYDNIEQQKDGLIYIYKDHKIGIYPQQKKAVYETITPQTHSFYKIIKNGREGYLDIRTMREYY